MEAEERRAEQPEKRLRVLLQSRPQQMMAVLSGLPKRWTEALEGGGWLQGDLLGSVADYTEAEWGEMLEDISPEGGTVPPRILDIVRDASKAAAGQRTWRLVQAGLRCPSLRASGPVVEPRSVEQALAVWATAAPRSQDKDSKDFPRPRLSDAALERRRDPDAARGKQVDRLVQMLIELETPAAMAARACKAPEQVLRGCAGGRRTATLKARLRVMAKATAFWKTVHRCSTYPTSAGMILDYLQEVWDPKCPTALDSLVAALAFFEEAGSIEAERRWSKHPLIKMNVADLQAQCERGLVTKQAPALVPHLLWKLEGIVMAVGEKWYTRCMAWYRLVRVWGGMRAGDGRSCSPGDLAMTEEGLKVTLVLTKTTGPGKRVQTLTAYVSREAWLGHRGWLDRGWSLWKRAASTRRWFLALPTKDGEDLRENVPLTYAEHSEINRRILSEMRQADETTPLLAPGSQLVWSEHSDRATLPTYARWLRMDKAEVDTLGRWHADGSANYNRLAKETAQRIQSTVAAAIREHGDKGVGAQHLLRQMANRLVERGVSRAAADQQAELLKFAPAGEEVIDLDGKEADGDGYISPLPVVPDVSSESDVESTKGPAPSTAGGSEGLQLGDLVVVVSRKRRRRCLHRSEGCPAPKRATAVEELTAETRYDRVCARCFPDHTDSGSSSTE